MAIGFLRKRPGKLEQIQAMLRDFSNQATFFALEGDMSLLNVKRNLKFIRGLTFSTAFELNAIDELTPSEIFSLVKYYQEMKSERPVSSEPPSTLSQSFHTTLNQSPYTYDIVSYAASRARQGVFSSSVKSSAPFSTNSVYGFRLGESEALSSTRYYSEDKTRYAQVIAKDGVFNATQQGLTEEQRADLAFEVASQFLANLGEGESEATLTGSEQMVHKINAALLYFKEELGEAFELKHPNFRVTLPEGVVVDPSQSNSDYIRAHLGDMTNTPEQLTLLKKILSPESVVESVQEVPVQSESQKAPPIDIEKLLNHSELSQESKVAIYDFAVELKKASNFRMEPGKALDVPQYAALQERFLARTEQVARCLSSVPSLSLEHKRLTYFYRESARVLQNTLTGLQKTEADYLNELKDLLQEAESLGSIKQMTSLSAMVSTRDVNINALEQSLQSIAKAVEQWNSGNPANDKPLVVEFSQDEQNQLNKSFKKVEKFLKDLEEDQKTGEVEEFDKILNGSKNNMTFTSSQCQQLQAITDSLMSQFKESKGVCEALSSIQSVVKTASEELKQERDNWQGLPF